MRLPRTSRQCRQPHPSRRTNTGSLRECGCQRHLRTASENTPSGDDRLGKSPDGRRIVAIRPLNDIEIASEAWGQHDPGQSVALILDDGSALICQADPGGNGPGYLRSGHITT